MDQVPLQRELCRASANGNLFQVMFLLGSGAEASGLNEQGRTALQVAMLDSTGVVEILLFAGANPNRPDPGLGHTVLHDAARGGFLDTVRLLLDHGAEVNVRDRLGNLPLHLAAREGHMMVVELLIERTFDPRRLHRQGLPAWELAALYQRSDTVSFIDQYHLTLPQ
ncbi:cyclin-dependent kinase 4 inhibitor C [Neosynchiropus ocellatus]